MIDSPTIATPGLASLLVTLKDTYQGVASKPRFRTPWRVWSWPVRVNAAVTQRETRLKEASFSTRGGQRRAVSLIPDHQSDGFRH
jgi:hypothetical protein